MGWLVSVSSWQRFTLGNLPPVPTGGWVGLRAVLETDVRRKILFLCRGSYPGRPVWSQTLYWATRVPYKTLCSSKLPSVFSWVAGRNAVFIKASSQNFCTRRERAISALPKSYQVPAPTTLRLEKAIPGSQSTCMSTVSWFGCVFHH